MAVSEAQLRRMMSKYKYRDMSVREILNVIRLYRDLRPVSDNYVFNDGTCRELLSLAGTIPVPYKRTTYNIPIWLWLLDSYPYNPPICFVKPTSTMTIKTGKSVDANGKIYHPYLHEWKHPPSDLLGCIQILIEVFGEEPPVFSRSPGSDSLMSQATGPPNTLDISRFFKDNLSIEPRPETVEAATQTTPFVDPEHQQAFDIYLDCLQKIRQVVDDTEAKLLFLKAKES